MKADYDSIIEPGIQDINIDQLEEIFVKPFNQPERRKYLVEHLQALLKQFEEIGVRFEIWIDGSFTTHKVSPNDIDIVCFAEPAQLIHLSTNKVTKLKFLLDNRLTKQLYTCDIYFVPSDDQQLRSYWRGWFGFFRNEKPKGIARIWIG